MSNDLPQRIDAFELELIIVECLIDILYQLPNGHEYYSKVMEELHTHRHNMRESYENIRSEIVSLAVHRAI